MWVEPKNPENYAKQLTASNTYVYVKNRIAIHRCFSK